MASPDFYQYAAQQRLQQLEAQKAQALADLAVHKASNDYQSAAESVQQIANLEAEKTNLVSLHNQYVESQTPPEPVQLSDEEIAAKPIGRMDWSDAMALARTSKYARDLDHNDPLVQAGYRAVLAGRARRGE
jgi:hypothetical protein